MAEKGKRKLNSLYLGILGLAFILAALRGSSLNSSHPDGGPVIDTSSPADLLDALKGLTGRGSDHLFIAVVKPDCDVCRFHAEEIAKVVSSFGGEAAIILSVVPTNFPVEFRAFPREIEFSSIHEEDLEEEYPMSVRFVPTFALLTADGFQVFHAGIPDWRQRIRFRLSVLSFALGGVSL